jgi:hypothetical protein
MESSGDAQNMINATKKSSKPAKRRTKVKSNAGLRLDAVTGQTAIRPNSAKAAKWTIL